MYPSIHLSRGVTPACTWLRGMYSNMPLGREVCSLAYTWAGGVGWGVDRGNVINRGLYH